MNISYNWLKEYVNFDLQPGEVADALTSIGLETGTIEEVQTIKGGLEGLIIAEVLTCVEHPNSDHLHITTVNIGEGEPIQVVCGAPNVAAGKKVVLATNGTTLYDGNESFTIKRSKIRGVESNGMICSEAEIGIGTDHSGIILLPDNAVPGTPAKEYYNIKSDYILEVDITPNRIDACSHFGVARDLAAFLKQNNKDVELKRPSVDEFAVQNHNLDIQVIVENSEACPRYTGLSISGVTVKESPEWLQNKLKVIGLRPINNIVDITNFIVHELGQPMHAFDASRIKGNKVVIRTTPEGTKFTTLDGVERTLSGNDLMICNSEEAMCIAGVFGGFDSGVTEATKDVFLEVAYFNPTWVRKTARRHGLNTDASFRNERGCDPNHLIYVLKRAALLIQELAGGTVSSEIKDFYPEKINPFPVDLTFKKINTLVGKEIPKETIKNILNALEITIVREDSESLSLLVPTYRVDVQRDVDVIEDILRIYGYNNIDFTTEQRSNLSHAQKPVSHELVTLISEQLTACGFHEILNNSLTKGSYYKELTTYPAANCVELLNPLSSDLNVMRQTLLFGGLESIAHNRNRKNGDIRFYEFGNCYFKNEEERNEENILSPYSEEHHLGLWISGNKVSGSWAHPNEASTFYELKAYIENIFRRLGVKEKKLVISQFSDEIYAKALQINTTSGKKLAVLGIVSKKLLKEMDIDTDVYYADINWNVLLKEIRNHAVTFTEISKFPSVKRDLALLVDKEIQFADIRKVAMDSERKLLKEVTLFDVYEGKNLEAGKKSYAISFLIQDETKTLNDKQIDAIMTKVIANLTQKFEAKLR
ncbi:MAG: phenylalanine--tRNA ligase subunit beta [Bacteroidales bacterium]|nr:phenylalanine--tRNA ligase subunit beta [Bacteroidales bacterium]MDD4821453.1 phenylalanine--tRNA ligase subunit beta [Bacteroidales bacterium]